MTKINNHRRRSNILGIGGIAVIFLIWSVFDDDIPDIGWISWLLVVGLIALLTILRLIGDRRRRARMRDNPQLCEALLILAGDRQLRVTNALQLAEALKSLALLNSGESARLSRGDRDYAEATRHGDFWSAAARDGGWWTLQSFTAEMTTDLSERQVRESRAAGSLRRRLALTFASPPPEFQLSTGQVQTIFTEYYLDRPFTIPRS